MEDLSKIGKELYALLKIGDKHPLERYVLAIDSNLDDDSLLRVIGERIGINIDDSDDAAVTLYLRLKDYLEKETNIERTRKIINMSFEEYNNPSKYANRLLEN
jgi:hypothetical protein